MIGRGLFALLLSVFSAATAQSWTVDLSKLAVAPNQRLGLSFPGDKTQHYAAIANAGLGITRLSASWGRIEPSQGRFDWSGLDRRLIALQAVGVQPFVTFESDADWATVPETQGVKNARPKDLETWARFVRAVVERYDGDGKADAPGLRGPVRYWQVANEWIGEKNRSGGWVGNADQLIDFIRVTEGAVKAADRKATVVLGGIAAFNIDIMLVARGGSEFTVRQRWSASSETVLGKAEMRGPEIAAIIDDFVMPVLRESAYDIADVHLYGPEERDAARIALLRKLTGRPVISAECGGPSLDYGDSYTPEGHFIAVLERNLGVLAADAKFCLWFRLGEGEGATYGNRRTGLYTAGAKPKPGVFAYRLLARLLDADAAVKLRGADQFVVERGALGPVTIGWGAAASAVRAKADKDGLDMLCLADADNGLLTSDINSCASDAVVLIGRNLATQFDQ